MEVHPRYPVLVALTTHDQIAMRQVPQLPGLVITGGGQDGLARVQGNIGNRQQVALRHTNDASIWQV